MEEANALLEYCREEDLTLDNIMDMRERIDELESKVDDALSVVSELELTLSV